MSTDSISTQPRRQHRRSEIEELFALRERHGLTWGQLSARSGIPVGTLTSWQQRIRKESEQGRGFVELATSPAPAPRVADFTVETTAGLRIHVPAGFDPDALTRLLSAVGVAC